MALILLSWALLQSTAMARESVRPGRPTSGFAALSVADHSPNSTHTVSFEHAGLGTWNWTVRVSDVNMPNASLYQLTDAHVAYTTHSFTWPSGGTLDDALQAEVAQKPELAGSSSCALLVDALFPLNVTEKYDPTSSDCTGMLGAECVKALTDLIGGIRSDCSDFSTSTTAVSQSCGGTFGVALGGGYGFSSARFGNYSKSSSNGTTLVSKGEPYAYAISEAYAAGNRTAYDLQASNVHILGLKGVYTSPASLICNRAAASNNLQPSGSNSTSNSGTGGNPKVDHSSATCIQSDMGFALGLTASIIVALLSL